MEINFKSLDEFKNNITLDAKRCSDCKALYCETEERALMGSYYFYGRVMCIVNTSVAERYTYTWKDGELTKDREVLF